MKRYSLTLDLKNDPELIQQYEEQHRAVWPEIINSIKLSGIENMQIYRFATRLFMNIELNDKLSLQEKAEADKKDAKMQEWENLMWNYQEALPGAAKGQKWVLMDKIFDLNEF